MNNTILLTVNSDLGKKNCVGYRALHIYETALKSELSMRCLCRDDYTRRKDKNIVKVFPLGNILPRVLNAYSIKINSNFYAKPFNDKLFEFFQDRHVKRSKPSFVHTFEWLNYESTTILDMPIAHPAYVQKRLVEKIVPLRGLNSQVPDRLTLAINQATVVVAPSLFVKESLLLAGCSEDKIKLVPFGATTEPDTERLLATKRLDNKLIFLFAGCVSFRKGVNYLLEAWKKLNLKNAELWIAGRVYTDFKRYMDSENILTDSVKVLGFRRNIRDLMKTAHVYVFPSLLEGSSKSIYEAMSFGMPVITTYNSGSIVEDGKDGFIVPIADNEQLAERMNYFYTNRNTITTLGTNGLNKVRDYTWERYGQQIIKIYKELL